MSENKRYYWLKLKEDFFADETISFIEEQENGKEYCLFYLKLCLKSLKNDGKLIRIIGNNILPYDVKALSKATNTDLDTVKIAMDLFQKIGLVSILETGEIYLNQINEMIGTETQMAMYMREKRAKDKMVNNVNPMLIECKIEYRDKEIREKNNIYTSDETKIEIKAAKKKHKYGEYKNVLLTDNELLKLIEELGDNKTNLVINYFSELKEMKGYVYKNDYLALKKWGIVAYNSKYGNVQTVSQVQEMKVYNSNPCPHCKENKLYEEKNYFICENCGAKIESEEAYAYFRKLHNRT